MKAVKDIRLIIAGEEFTGWSSWEAESCLITPADAWSLTVPNIDGDMAGLLTPGLSVKLILDGVQLACGYIDVVEYRDGEVTVQGRDPFGQLIDCSATPGTWHQVTLLTLATSLGQTWGIIWTVQSGITLGSRAVKIEPGESIWDVLSRVAKKDGVLIWCDPNGAGIIGRPDYTSPPVHRLCRYLPLSHRTSENNIMSGGARLSWTERYSSITVAGTSGNSTGSWGRTSHRRAVVTDGDVPVTRPLILMDGDLKTLAQAKAQATLEGQRREHDSTVLEYQVSGHYGEPYANGATAVLWTPGQRVEVVDEEAGIFDIYMLTTRRLQLDDDQGPVTRLTLHPEGWMA